MRAYVNPVKKTAENGLEYKVFQVIHNRLVFAEYQTAHTATEVAKAINRTSPSHVSGMVLRHHGFKREKS